jgi:hypothetical protein
VNQRSMIKKDKCISRHQAHLALLDGHMGQLGQVERRMDGLFQEIVDGLGAEETCRAWEQLDALVSGFPDLRFTTVDQHPRRVATLLLRLDPETGPLPGFREAVEQLCLDCTTPHAIRRLRSRLYTVAARVAETCPEMMPTVALAVLSLDGPDQARNPFVEMVVCASAIESLDVPPAETDGFAAPDVSTWLAAEPSDALLAAVGERQAYYYASIPGVLPLLDSGSVLFDARRLAPYARSLFGRQDRYGEGILHRLVNPRYKALLRAEIERVRKELGEQYPPHLVADAEMLIHRALQSLDDLPPHVNPLLQAIFVQSWVRYLQEAC